MEIFVPKNAKILVLEDDQLRIKFFKKIFKEYTVVFVDHVNDAIYINETLGPFDVNFLDHDLGGKVYVPSSHPDTGYQFAKYLAEKKVQAKFIFHTMNYNGAQNMLSLLKEAIYIPFNVLVKQLER